MYRVIKKSEGTIRRIAENKIAINYITRDISPDVSLVLTEGKDYSEKERTPYNRIYYVLDGELVLTFGNEKISLHEGDSCFISRGSTYGMSGSFRVIVVNQPAFGI